MRRSAMAMIVGGAFKPRPPTALTLHQRIAVKWPAGGIIPASVRTIVTTYCQSRTRWKIHALPPSGLSLRGRYGGRDRPRPLADAWRPHTASVSMGQPAWRPPCDIIETATELIVLAELAGVDHEQLDVLLFEDALIVEGERRLPPTRLRACITPPRSARASCGSNCPCRAPLTPTSWRPATSAASSNCGCPKRAVPLRPTPIPVSRPVDAALARAANQGTDRQPERDDDGS